MYGSSPEELGTVVCGDQMLSDPDPCSASNILLFCAKGGQTAFRYCGGAVNSEGGNKA